MKMPVVFVSHGAPDIALTDNLTTQYWRHLGQTLPRPSAIVMLSAHWETSTPYISAVAPPIVYDFSGFPAALKQFNYPVTGSNTIIQQLRALLSTQNISAQIVERGLDHGAWIPLLSIYPKADIPVIQLSIQPQYGTAWHLALGEALRPLREQGVLIMGSGAVTHNFGWLTRTATPYPPAQTFANWLYTVISERDETALRDYRTRAPNGAQAHPTDEHLLPLLVCFGASDTQDTLAYYSPEYTYGGLAMDVYSWITH